MGYFSPASSGSDWKCLDVATGAPNGLVVDYATVRSFDSGNCKTFLAACGAPQVLAPPSQVCGENYGSTTRTPPHGNISAHASSVHAPTLALIHTWITTMPLCHMPTEKDAVCPAGGNPANEGGWPNPGGGGCKCGGLLDFQVRLRGVPAWT